MPPLNITASNTHCFSASISRWSGELTRSGLCIAASIVSLVSLPLSVPHTFRSGSPSCAALILATWAQKTRPNNGRVTEPRIKFFASQTVADSKTRRSLQVAEKFMPQARLLPALGGRERREPHFGISDSSL